jgi:hypothetical protein
MQAALPQWHFGYRREGLHLFAALHGTARLRSISFNVRSDVFTAVAMKNAVFWDVTPHGSCKKRRFGGTSILTTATRRYIPVDGIHFISLKFNITFFKVYHLPNLESTAKFHLCQLSTINQVTLSFVYETQKTKRKPDA